ncbi:conserved hypothetical protein [Coccidioides posadasii str. Silveira]|uniref:BHLH domain-containing protein n=2 Tax=Coccidioides posadasii (strain RMSCC 757 / Silveira) TaxID=443226 RepID=E9CUP4_COCPS|nr:conserved hypothetical protein [Coccidioides posadasii str. Silveira]
MNEEFATLKNMIPACKGQEMHKLAILQASIEYVNYLEQCIADLKAANIRRDSTPTSPTWNTPKEPGTGLSSYSASPEFNPHPEPSASYSQTTSPRASGDTQSRSSHTSPFEIIPMILPSPALPPSNTPFFPPRVHRDTLSSNTSTISTVSTTSTTSSTTSPIIPPHQQQQQQYQCQHSHQRGASTPSMLPQAHSSRDSMDVDMDREATTALLMLNIDRRASSGIADMPRPAFPRGNSDAGGKNGISVHDLLSH